jgi:hypothetical protein
VVVGYVEVEVERLWRQGVRSQLLAEIELCAGQVVNESEPKAVAAFAKMKLQLGMGMLHCDEMFEH